jgi:hypothetical protein
MDVVLLILAVLTTAALVWAGVYFTFRGFRSLDHPPVPPKPKHASAVNSELKHFFEGKQCATCKRAIPPVHAFEPRPGLLNPKTREAISWDDIPDTNLPATLESHVAICSNCALIEVFRKQHPELVVDRHRTAEIPTH